MKRRLSVFVAIAIAMALALVMGIGAKPALAETSYAAIGGETIITKYLVVNSDANIPTATFTYTITRGTPAPATASSVEILASDVAASVGSAVFSNSDTSNVKQGTPTNTDDRDRKYASKNITVTFPDGSFTKPGVYRYVVREVNGGKSGVTYDPADRYLDVFVVANDNDVLTISSCVLHKEALSIGLDYQYSITDSPKSSTFTNSIEQSDFTFTKAITGNQADKNKRFTFTFSIANAIPGVYPIRAIGVSSNPTTITVAGDGTGTGTYELTDGSSLQVIGLNHGATCTVKEDAEDYTATYKLDSGNETTLGNTPIVIDVNADHIVAFKNSRAGTIPTGVIVTVAPFAIGILLSGALIVYLVTKRRNDYV